MRADYDRSIRLVITSVYLGSDNAGSMEGKDKHRQVGSSTKEFINKEKINKKNFVYPCGENK